MGNCLRRCFGGDSDSDYGGVSGYGGLATGPVANTVVGYTAVARDLFEFETTNKVPELLGFYVAASKATQRIWFEKLLVAWRRTNPPPTTAKEVACLLVQTLRGHFGIQDLLKYYDLPWPIVLVPTTMPIQPPTLVRPPAPIKPLAPVKPSVPIKPSAPVKPSVTLTPSAPVKPSVPLKPTTPTSGAWLIKPEDPDILQFEIQTLPVNWPEKSGDGDGITVFVDVKEDAREAQMVPVKIQEAVKKRRKALARKNSQTKATLLKQIKAENYMLFDGPDGEASCLAHKYKIRLRGVDAPEIDQAYGEEARDVLRDLVQDQRLVIHVYKFDDYERAVADVYCRGKCIQEKLLRKGAVWHFKAHDKRYRFAKWEKEARAARIGLWAAENPVKPWVHRRKQRKLNKSRGSFKKQRGA